MNEYQQQIIDFYDENRDNYENEFTENRVSN